MSQLTTPHPRKTYDFSPFLSSHIITSRLPPHTPPTALPIPESLIASPLAPNLAPATILDLKEFLTGVSLTGLSVTYGALAGNGCWNGIGKDNGREKGTEVWECWKRAYDLWNGCYVEGRVDPVWMREEYERIKKEPEEERERERKHQYAPRGKKQMPPSTGNTPPSVGDNWSTQADNGMEPGEDIYPTFTTPISRGTPPIPTLRSAEEVAKEDGSTGDFMPMKLLPEYFAPPTDAGGNYPEDWEDVLANTVWRPRRVGERELEVGIDGEWWQKSEFEFDGGVDCGRSPYPCLRYVVEYLRRDGCFLKKKVWDGVTGTIFNMPTRPASTTSTDSISDRQRRISALCGNFYRDKAPMNRNPEYFPLDIRRLDRIDSETGKRHPVTPLLEDGEELVRWPWNNPEGTFEQLDGSDPWYAMEEQQTLQLVPPRKYPPGKAPYAGGDTLLPTDDTVWREEMENDANFRSQYFITNLHGSTLIVNGLEIKLGQIAGPLPEFAIIETPGNQISFWFGPQGRDWRGGPDDAPQYTSQWKTLRRNPGWEHFGLTAGQVWDMKIRDQLRREYKGEEHDDDAQWAEWKTTAAKGIHPTSEKKSPLEMVIWNGHPGPSPAYGKQTPEAAQLEFSTELEELQWIVTKAYPLKDVTPALEQENIIEPPASALWPGPYTDERPDTVHQGNAQRTWDRRREEILQQQRDMNAMLVQERAARAHEKKEKIDSENRKRKAASSSGPAAKKARLGAAAQRRAEAQAEREKWQAEFQEESKRQKEEFENNKVRYEKLQADAIIAAKTREALKAQAARLSLLSERQQEKEKQKIIDRVKADYAVQQKKERKLRETKIKELNKERAEKGLQLLPEVTPISEEGEQHLANEARKKAQKKEEERRKQAELEKTRQENEKRRREAEKNHKETVEALNKTGPEVARDDLGVGAQKVAAAKAAEAEKRRLQYIADQEVRNQQTRKAGVAAAARAEAARRARLFKEKLGVFPATGLRLDGSGNAELGQGLASPKKKAPPKKLAFKILSADDLEKMTEEQWLEYGRQLSLLPPTPPGNSPTKGKPVDFSKMSYEERLEYAVKESKRPLGGKSLEELNTVQGYVASLRDTIEEDARMRLDLRAKVEGVSVEQYVRNHGFSNADDYIWAEIKPVGPKGFPEMHGPADLPANVLPVSRYWIQHEAQAGLEIRARLEKRSMDAIVKEKGYANTKQYLQALSDLITMNDLPPPIRHENAREPKWEALNQRITDAGEWEYRIRALPKPKTTGNRVDTVNRRFAIL